MTMNNYYMLGRTKIDNMRAIAERELEELKAKCKNLDKETEDDDRHRLAEIKVSSKRLLQHNTLDSYGGKKTPQMSI